MNRQERRNQEKKLKKNREIINSMTPAQAKIADLVANERGNIIAEKYIENFSKLIDRSMTAALIEYGIEYNDIEVIQNNMSVLYQEDSIKSNQLELERGLNMAKIEEEVKQAVREVLKKFTLKKLAIEELIFKFPKLSKSMLLAAYGRVELEFKNEIYIEIEELAKNSNAEQTIKTLMKKFGLVYDIASKHYYTWKKDFMTKKETVVTKDTTTIEKATSKELEKNAEKIIEKAKERQCEEKAPIINKVEDIEMKKLLVLEETVIKTIKVVGENGTYEAETNKGVVLSRENAIICFKNEEELNEWVTEFKEVFKLVV